MTKVNQVLYDQYIMYTRLLASAMDNRDERATLEVNSRIASWAAANNINMSEPVELDTTVPPVTDDPGVVKPGGWGANTDANTWVVVSMKSPSTEFKVVDDKGVNVATNFNTKVGAQAYITAHKDVPVPPVTGDKDQFGIRKIFPDKPGGVIVTKSNVVYKIRNYRSGKPSEPTCELTITVPITHAQDIETTTIVQMTGMKHNDTVDFKHRGPGHTSGSGKAWYCIDQETDGGLSGKKFQVERPHPSMHDASKFVKTYFSPPKLANARFGWKAITVNKSPTDVYIAAWINTTPDDESGWKKIWDCHDTGQIPSGQITPPTGGNVQFRCDGIIGKPTFEKSSVREIVYNEASATAL